MGDSQTPNTAVMLEFSLAEAMALIEPKITETFLFLESTKHAKSGSSSLEVCIYHTMCHRARVDM